MQKVVEFLEKHVQWVALGLGALWLLFMAYTYVLNPPAAVNVGGETLTAGKVDKYTVEKAAAPLQAAINGTTAPEMPVESFAGAFQSTMNFEGAPEVTLANNWRRNDVRFEPQRGGGGGVAPVPGAPVPVGIALLPEPPVAATPADVAMGRSTIVPPVVPGQVAPALPAGQAAVAGAQPAGPATVDKDWVTQSFKIPVHEIGKQFAAANIKPGLPHATTVFLQVEMVRQEQLPSGEWDPKSEVVIKPLENGMVRVPFPAENAGRNLEHTYLNWAVANAGDILQPTFYQVTTGDPWHKPGAPIVQQAVFNPAAHVGGKGNLTDEQWKQVLDFRRQQYQQKQAQPQQRGPRQPRQPRGAPEMEDFGGETFAPRDPDREAFAQVRRPGPPRPPVYYEDPALMEDPAMYEGDMGMGAVMPNVPQAGVPGVDFPTGEFEPAKWPNPTMDCWAHDDTVQPGKTYRYKMRYRIKNPLYGTVNIAKNPKDATKFYLTSPDSPWGSAVSVPELTNFFIAAGRIQGAPKIRFDIFRFHGGVQEKLSMEAGPGDVIGKVDRDIDFKTRWTIVDFRSDGRQDNVILVDEDGNTVIRNVNNDRNNPLYKKLQEEIAAKEAGVAAIQPNGR